MWLAVDCGNSCIKWTLMQGKTLHTDSVQVHSIHHRRYHSPLKKAAQQADSIWLSCVSKNKKQVLSILGKRTKLVRARTNGGGVHNTYHQPATLGSDRWLSLIAAAKWQKDVIIIDAGTATTIDLLCANGQFIGGVILSGVHSMQTQLANRTTLPSPTFSQSLKFIKSSIPQNTKSGMHQGALFAIAGAATLLRKQYLPKARYIITGGDAEQVLPYLPTATKHIPYMPLHGLVRLHTMQS